jgi:hypothetical protein
MTTGANSQVPQAPPRRGLTIALGVIAGIETLGTLSSVSLLFGDLSEVISPGLTGWAGTITIVVAPLAAIAALVLALTGRHRHAIIALAALILLTWLNMLPSVALSWDTFPGPGLPGALVLLEIFGFPLLAAAATVLALRDQRLGLATVLVSLPTIINILSVAAFAIGVMIYGF